MTREEQEALIEDYQSFTKSRERSEADFIESLKEQFDISKKISNSYKNIVNQIKEQGVKFDKAKDAQEALSKKISKNNQELNNSKDRQIGLQSAINEKLKEEEDQKTRIQDLSARMIANEEDILHTQLLLKNGVIDEAKAHEEIARLQQLNAHFSAEQQISQDAIKQSTSEKLALDQRLTKEEGIQNKLKKQNEILEKSSNRWQSDGLKLMMQKLKLQSQLIFVKMLQLGYERFVQLDKAAENFRKETGFSVTQMKELRKDAESLNVQFADMGVGIENVYKSAKALTDVFGRTSLVSKEALQNVSLLSANLGVAEEASANVLATFQGIGGATEQAAMNVIKVGAGISEKAGVPFKLVMQDVANASEQTLTMIGANPSKLMKSAIAARAMGLELNKMVASQRKLLDFSASINDELEASAMLGKNINFQLARQYAFEGRVEDAAKATLDTVKKAGDFNKMNVYQREALAKASGMELKDLTKMMAVDAQREEIMNGTDEAKKAVLKAQEKELEQLKERNKLDSEDLVAQNQKALMQQKMQGIMTKLKNIFDSISIAFADILEPIITPLAAVIVPAFRLVGMLAKFFGFILKGLLLPITLIGQGFGKVADYIDGAISSFTAFSDDVKEYITYALGIAGGLMTILFVGKSGWSSLWSNISKTFLMAKDGLSSLIKGDGPKLGEGLKSGFDSLKGKIGLGKKAVSELQGPPLPPGFGDSTKATVEAAKSSDKVKSSSGSSIKKFLKDLSEGLKSMAGADVLLGAFNLIPASIGLVAMIPGYLGATLLSKLDGKAVKKALSGLADGLTAMASPSVLLGSLALTVAAAGLAVMLVGIPTMAAIAFLGIPFSAGLTAMSVGLSALGGNPMAWLGIAAIAALSLSFVGFAYGVKLVAEGFAIFAESVTKSIEPLIKLGLMAPLLYVAAGGITALSYSLAAFGAGQAAAGLGGFTGKLLGGDPINRLEKFVSIGEKLKGTADAINTIASATSKFGMVDAFSDAVGRLVYSLEKLNEQLGETKDIKIESLKALTASTEKLEPTTAAGTAEKTSAASVESKLVELITLLREGAIAVNLDGTKVSQAMAARGRE